MFNEAETGSRFRIAADVFADTGTPPFGLPLPAPRRLHVKQAIHMANSFQSASCAKLRLAYQEETEKTETPLLHKPVGPKGRSPVRQGGVRIL